MWTNFSTQLARRRFGWWSQERVDARWEARHTWGGRRVAAMIIQVGGYYNKVWVWVGRWVWVCVQGRAGGARAGGAQRVQPCIHIWGGWACVQGRQEGVRGGCVLRVGAVQEGRARCVRSACGLQCSVLPVQVSVGALQASRAKRCV